MGHAKTPGAYIGIFELALMTHAFKLEIILHVEERPINMVDEFVPTLRECKLEGTMHIVWVCKEDDEWCTVHGQYHKDCQFLFLVPMFGGALESRDDVVSAPTL